MEKKNIIIAGTTGMIGESVLDQCLKHPLVDKILIVNRRASGIQHSKVKEIVIDDFSKCSSFTEEFREYDACLFCIGVSSIGKDEATYTRLTYNLTIDFATALSEANSSTTFAYISGAGTDSSERGRIMWARVKGKTENDLMKLPFKRVYNFRPAGLIPYLKIKPNQTYQSIKYLKWLMIPLRFIFPNQILKLSDFAVAMINSIFIEDPKKILEVRDIRKLSEFKLFS